MAECHCMRETERLKLMSDLASSIAHSLVLVSRSAGLCPTAMNHIMATAWCRARIITVGVSLPHQDTDEFAAETRRVADLCQRSTH